MKKITTILAMTLAAATFAFAQETTTITFLETSDIHGAIAPWDYATDTYNDCGLEKVATVIKQQRQIDPELVLLDCGDNVQDNLIQEFRFEKIHPMVQALNSLNYDAWELGNHEFNFEFKSLQNIIKQNKATLVNANIYKKNGKRYFKPYIIKEVKGVKIAIIGLTAPHVPTWEAATPDHFRGMSFTTPMEETEKVLKEVMGKADLYVVLSHYGASGEYGTQGMTAVAEKFGKDVDIFFIGHAHETFARSFDNGTVMLEPGSKGSDLAKVTVELVKENGKWIKKSVKPEIIPIKKQNIEADPEMTALMKNLDEKSRAMSNMVVGKIADDFLPSLWWNGLEGIPTAIMQDTAMIDLINKVQMKETGADVSLAALFDSTSNLTKGDFRKRDGVKVYKYDNTLMSVNVTGAQLKKIMEKYAGNFFNQVKPGDVTVSFNENIRMYMYDMFAGVDYEINVSKPAGSRIENVMYKGAPLKDDQKLVLAVNNYRYGCILNDGFISSSDLIQSFNFAVRDLISDYVSGQGTIVPECDNNWKITGFDSNSEAAQKVYEAVRRGEIKIPTSSDGRTPNVKSLNVNMVK